MCETKCCEYCGKDINAKYMTCPLCGGQLPDTLKPGPSLCPRCMLPLISKTHENEVYDFCPSCSGLWLERDEFHNATREFNVFRKKEMDDTYLRRPSNDPVNYIPCIRCGKLMSRKNFARISGVIIDECSRHGVWLDANELEKIQHFIADGGLERSQDRAIQINRSELRELATKVDQTAFTQKIIHFWNLKRWLFGD